MSLEIYVQVMRQVDAVPSYDWVTVGVIKKPQSIDVDYLKSEVALWVKKEISFRPTIDVVRFVVMQQGIVEMKITINDFFKSIQME